MHHLTPAEQDVYDTILFLDAGDGCWASYATIAEVADTTSRTVISSLRKLEKMNLVFRAGKRKHANGNTTVIWQTSNSKSPKNGATP